MPQGAHALPALPGRDREIDMPQKSRIETELKAEDLKDFQHMMATGRCTIDDLVGWLEKRGYEISRSSVGRYSQSFERVAARLRESRQITDAVTAELGESATQGKQGRLLVEMTRTLVFDLLMKMQDEEAELDTKDVMMLGKGLAELGKALRSDQDYETKIREQIVLEERAKAAEIVEEAAARSPKGLSREAIDAIKADILGIEK